MNDFGLHVSLPHYPFKIAYGDQLLFIGSCFSDEIAVKAKYYGFNVDSNPFGTVFHPLALSRFINESLLPKFNERIVQRNDVFLSWDANSTFHAMSEIELKRKLEEKRKSWKEMLSSGDYLFVTFGTAWEYKRKNTNELVANCHKFSGSEFSKELTDQALIVEKWKEVLHSLQELNPKLKVVFTVSPVRHSKDGLIENNQSKAVLIDAIRQLMNIEKNCFYFPSYEIVIDELRDYRFYKLDRVHPNEEAINYVWNRFSDVFFNEETLKLNREVQKVRLAEAHRSIFHESLEFRKHQEATKELRFKLIKEHPEVNLG